MKRCLLLFALLLLVTSCSLVDMVRHTGDRRLAKVGRSILYESDVVGLIPSGISSEDSALMVKNYVNSWVNDKLMLMKAEDMLSHSDSLMNAQIEEFRKALVCYRYEKLYLDMHLDTVVSGSEISSFYLDHKEKYVVDNHLVKAIVIRISKKSPYYETIRMSYDFNGERGLSEFETLCRSSAEKYTDFGNKWVDVSLLARELGVTQSTVESYINYNSFEIDVESDHYMVCILDRIAPGVIVPEEYVADQIKETILSARKQSLLEKMEQDLLEEALKSKTLKLYEQD